MAITKPTPKENFYFSRYIDLTSGDDLIYALDKSHMSMMETLGKLSDQQSNYKYQEGKWTVKEVLSHCIDTERVLAYRAMCFSRNEIAELPDFDQDRYVKEDMASELQLSNLLEEYDLVRRTTVLLFKRMKAENLDFSGIASNTEITPRELGWTIAGHDLHHLNVLREKYLVDNLGSGLVNLKITW